MTHQFLIKQTHFEGRVEYQRDEGFLFRRLLKIEICSSLVEGYNTVEGLGCMNKFFRLCLSIKLSLSNKIKLSLKYKTWCFIIFGGSCINWRGHTRRLHTTTSSSPTSHPSYLVQKYTCMLQRRESSPKKIGIYV